MDKYIIGIGTKAIIPVLFEKYHFAGVVEFVRLQDSDGTINKSELPIRVTEVWGTDREDALKKLKLAITDRMPDDVEVEFRE